MAAKISLDNEKHIHDLHLGYDPNCSTCEKIVEAASYDLGRLMAMYAIPRAENTRYRLARAVTFLEKVQAELDDASYEINDPVWDDLHNAPNTIMLEIEALLDRFPRRSPHPKRTIIEFVMACYFVTFHVLPDSSSRLHPDRNERQPNSPSTRFFDAVLELARKHASDEVENYLKSLKPTVVRHTKKLPIPANNRYRTMRKILKAWSGKPTCPEDLYPYTGDLSSWFVSRSND